MDRKDIPENFLVENIIKILDNQKIKFNYLITLKFPLIIKDQHSKNLEYITKIINDLKIELINLNFIATIEISSYIGVHAHVIVSDSEKLVKLGNEKMILIFNKIKEIKIKEIIYIKKIVGDKDTPHNILLYCFKTLLGDKNMRGYTNIDLINLQITQKISNELSEGYDKVEKLKFLIKQKYKSVSILEYLSLFFESINYGLKKRLNPEELVRLGMDLESLRIKKRKQPLLTILLNNLINYINKEKIPIGESKDVYDLVKMQVFSELYNSGVLFCLSYVQFNPTMLLDVESDFLSIVNRESIFKSINEAMSCDIENLSKKYNHKINMEQIYRSLLYVILSFIFNKVMLSKRIVQIYSKMAILKEINKIIKFYFRPFLSDEEIEKFLTHSFIYYIFSVVIEILKLRKNIFVLREKKEQDINGKIITKGEFFFDSSKNLNLDFQKNQFKDDKIFNAKLFFGIFFLKPREGKEQTSNIYNFTGGFIFNEVFQFLPLIHKKEQNKGILYFQKQKFLSTINLYSALQFEIDPLFLDCFFEKVFKEIKDKNGKIYYDMNINFENQGLYSLFLKEINDLQNKKIMNKSQKNEKYKMGLEQYRKYCFYLFILFIKEKRFSFAMFLDVRGRIYSSGGMNFQSIKGLRNILVFSKSDDNNESCYIKFNLIGNGVKLQLKDQKIKDIPIIEYMISLLKNKEYKNYYELVSYFDNIFGEFLQNNLDEKILKYVLIVTRCLYLLLDRNKTQIEIMESNIYIPYISFNDANAEGSLLSHLILKDNDILYLYDKENFDYYINKGKEFLKILSLHSFFNQFAQILNVISFAIGRKVIKKSVMTLIYFASSITLFNYIKEGLNDNNIDLNSITQRNNDFRNLNDIKISSQIPNNKLIELIEEYKKGKNKNTIFIKLFLYFLKNQEIMKILYEFATCMKLVLGKVNVSIKEKQLYLTVSLGLLNKVKYLNFYIETYKDIEKVNVFGKIKKISKNHFDYTQMDVDKIVTSNFVNTIHFLDSQLCYFILFFMLKEKNKSIITIHDSFGVNFLYKDLVKLYYISGIRSIALNQSFFKMYKNFFEAIKKNLIESDKGKKDLNQHEQKLLIDFYNKMLQLDKRQINVKNFKLFNKEFLNLNYIKTE